MVALFGDQRVVMVQVWVCFGIIAAAEHAAALMAEQGCLRDDFGSLGHAEQLQIGLHVVQSGEN